MYASGSLPSLGGSGWSSASSGSSPGWPACGSPETRSWAGAAAPGDGLCGPRANSSGPGAHPLGSRAPLPGPEADRLSSRARSPVSRTGAAGDSAPGSLQNSKKAAWHPCSKKTGTGPRPSDRFPDVGRLLRMRGSFRGCGTTSLDLGRRLRMDGAVPGSAATFPGRKGGDGREGSGGCEGLLDRPKPATVDSAPPKRKAARAAESEVHYVLSRVGKSLVERRSDRVRG